MPEEKVLPKERIASSFKTLAAASVELNDAVRDLGQFIAVLEASLRSLNLGVSAWHQIAGHEDHSGAYWSRDIGFSRVADQWRIALRNTNGNHEVDQHREEIWAFVDGPRWMCVEGASKLPELFDELIKRTTDTTQKLKTKKKETEEFADAVRAVRAAEEAARKARK